MKICIRWKTLTESTVISCSAKMSKAEIIKINRILINKLNAYK